MRRRILLNGISTNKFVDLGLSSGLLWATGNITKDASENYYIAEPTEYGAYFSWGNIDGHRALGQTDNYNFNSTNYNGTAGASLTGNIPTDATYDAARARLGDYWRIPTNTECNELISECTWSWKASGNMDYNGVAGYEVVGPNGRKMFLPCTGYYFQNTYDNPGEYGYVWSKGYSDASNAYYMYWASSEKALGSYYRFVGRCIRAVFKPMYSITITLTGDSVQGITVTVTDSEGISHSGTTDSNGVARLTGVASGRANISASGYGLTNSKITVNASSRYFTCGLVPFGIYAYYADGSLKSEAEADTNAIGVAVVTADCCFVLSKSRSRLRFSSEDTSTANAFNELDIVKATDLNSAIVDLDGYNNTIKIINHLTSKGYSSPAVNYCMSQFNGQGYLGAFGEWNAVYTNLSSVNSILTKIGGTNVQNDGYTTTSTLYVTYNTFPSAVDRRNGGYGIMSLMFSYSDTEVRAFKAF